MATSEGYADLLNLMLENGAIINDKDSWNGTGLIRAAERGHWLVVGTLLGAGIERDHVNRIGYQAIHESILLGEDTDDYVTTVRVLAAGGVELTRPSGQQGLTPAQMAGRKGHARQAAALAAVLDSAEPADPDGALLQAAASGNPDAADGRSDTPWLVTGVTGSVEMGQTLMLAHPDLTLRNRFGGLSPIPAAERGHVDYIEWVVGTGVDLGHVNDLGWTALLEAVILGDGGPRHQEVVEALVEAGVDTSIPDGDGVTALEHARRRGYTEIAALLGG